MIHESAQATDALRGIFITFEGGEGAGKTTHIRFLSETLRAHGREVLCLREPGGTEVGEQLRAVVLDPANGGMSDEAELLIYEAARAQLVHQVIEPALAAGTLVVCDRFYDSTTAYQAHAAGLDTSMVEQANSLAVNGCHPALTLVFDLDPAVAQRRSARTDADRMEAKGMAYQQRVASGFREIAKQDPQRVKIIDASGDIKCVFAQVRAQLGAAGIDLDEEDVAYALDGFGDSAALGRAGEADRA